MSNPYGNQQQPYGQPPAQGSDPYAQQHAGYYGGQPYGPQGGRPPAPQSGQPYGPQGGRPPAPQSGQPYGPQGGRPPAPQSGQPYGPQGGRPPAPQGPPAQAAPIVWDDHSRPTSAPWSGPGAFAPAPATQRPSAPEQPSPSAQPAAPAVPAQGSAPVVPPVAAPPAAAPNEPPEPAEAPTATSPAVGDQQATDDALTIGRGRDNAIVLDDMLVSRQHVRITADDEGLVLEDLGSRNGTFVNGRRVERTHLHEGDHIGVGSSTFEVRDGWLVTI